MVVLRFRSGLIRRRGLNRRLTCGCTRRRPRSGGGRLIQRRRPPRVSTQRQPDTANTMSDLPAREYGTGSPPVIVLHGGPAAAGDAAGLARGLSARWHVLEPFQRGSGRRPLTVATHVRDLDELVRERCAGARPAVVGHSRGAMLALAYAAVHPQTPVALVLVGCGTFSSAARAEFEARLDARLTIDDRARIAQIDESGADPDHRLGAFGRLIQGMCGYDVETAVDDEVAVDALAHQETWADMLRLQSEGVYPAGFAAIDAPVLMLHGEADPHPGVMTSRDLRRYIPHLEYRELPKCGHYPWLERQARKSFFETLDAWLTARCRVADEAG